MSYTGCDKLGGSEFSHNLSGKNKLKNFDNVNLSLSEKFKQIIKTAEQWNETQRKLQSLLEWN